MLLPRTESSHHRLFFCLAFLFCAAGFLLANWGPTRGLSLPPGQASTDPARYVNLGWSLSQGRGFSLDYGNPELRAVYEANNGGGEFDYLLRKNFRGVTTFTPPGYPMLLAGLFTVAGGRPHLARWLNIVLMALACAIAATLAFSRGGLVAGLATTLGLTLDGRVQYFAGEAHAEAFAALAVTALFALWLRQPRVHPAVLGAVGAGLILIRSNYLLWLPFAALGLLWLLKDQTSEVRHRRLRAAGLAAGTLVLVLTPWMIRNCLVMGRFEPLPTNGRIGLVGAYCDGSYENWGCFSSGTLWRTMNALASDPDMSKALVREREALAADQGQREALQWVAKNWHSKLPILMGMRCLNHLQMYPWRSNNYFPYPARLFVLLALLGSILTARPGSLERQIGTLLLVDLVVVAFTWAIEGRFLVPLWPILYLAIGLGAARLFQRGETRHES